MLCKGDNLLQNFPSVPNVLEVWSIGSHQPLSSAYGNHASDKPSTSKVHGKKGKVNFPCKLCEGNHPIHLCPLMDEASKELENLTDSQPRLPAGYLKLSPNPLLVDQGIDQNPYLINPTLSESESRESVLDQLLFKKMVDLVPLLVNCAFSVASEPHNAQVLMVSSVSNELEGNPLIPEVHGSSSHVPIEQESGSHIPTTHPLSSLVTSFDWI